MGEKALFPMRRCHSIEYNIFKTEDGKFQGYVFDHNRRIYSKTPAYDDIEKAIKFAKNDCGLRAKGQCVSGEIVDEGRELREREEKEYLNFKKEVRKQQRERNHGL